MSCGGTGTHLIIPKSISINHQRVGANKFIHAITKETGPVLRSTETPGPGLYGGYVIHMLFVYTVNCMTILTHNHKVNK